MAGSHSNHSPFLHQKSHHQQPNHQRRTTSNTNSPSSRPIHSHSKNFLTSSPATTAAINNINIPKNNQQNNNEEGGGGRDDAPPHHQKQKNHQRPPVKASRVNVPSTARRVIVDDEETEDDDSESDEEETDDEDFTLSPQPIATSRRSSADDVENICLACAGQCRCGGAEGRSIFIASPSSAFAAGSTKKSEGGLKIRLSHAASGNSRSSSVSSARGPPPASASTAAPSVPSPKKRGRPRKDAPPVARPAPSPPKKSSSTSSTSRNPSQPLPARVSLRQVLAASIKDATAAAAARRSSSPEGDAIHQWQRKRETLSEVSDLDLEEESENDIERAEEQALRAEWEKKKSGTDETSDEEDTELESDWEEEDEGREAKRRRMRDASEGVLNEEDEEEFFRDEEALPFEGGRGVVTWSDYDSVDESDHELTKSAKPSATTAHATIVSTASQSQQPRSINEFEEELEELFAFSEAVAGPVQAEDYDLGGIWFEEISNEGDAEDGDTDSSDDEDDEEGETVIVMAADGSWEFRGGGDSSSESVGTSSEVTSSEEDDDEDDGETTDSLDSDDHVGLVRFGIEVDSDDDEDSDAEEGGPMAGTASLADVQAPTSADLATLPSCFVFSSASTSTAEGTAKGKGKQVNNSFEDIEEEDEDGEEEGRRTSPAMGVFEMEIPMSNGKGKKKHQSGICLVIDESDAVAPSPFSKRKTKRRGRQLLDGSPSSRRRSDSKLSTTTSFSVTSGSGSNSAPSPLLLDNQTSFDFDLDDVLHSSVISRSRSVSSDSDASRQGPSSDPSTVAVPGLSDLTRWTRIPIGAFRSSTMPSTPFFSVTPSAATTTQSPNRSSPHPQNPRLLRSAGPSLSHTLSSPHARITTKREIERRMLTSPVFGPTGVGGLVYDQGASVMSHRLKRKAKKTQSSLSQRIGSPK